VFLKCDHWDTVEHVYETITVVERQQNVSFTEIVAVKKAHD